MPYEIVIKSSKKIEGLLSGLGATGKGLHEKATSVEDIISHSLVKKIRFLASLRNKLIHEDGYELSELELYKFKLISEEVCEILSIDNEAVNSSEDASPIFEGTNNYKSEGIGVQISSLIESISKLIYPIFYGSIIFFLFNVWFN